MMRTCLVSMLGELKKVRATERTSSCARSILVPLRIDRQIGMRRCLYVVR